MTNDKPKAKMTRAEAIKMFLKHIPEATYHGVDSLVDFYIEAGMLEVVEEPTRSYVPLGFKFPFKNYESWAECCKALVEQGWDIIKR